MRDEILKNAGTITQLKELNAGREANIDAWLSTHGLQSKDVIFQGLRARNKDFSVMLDAKTAKVIGVADFRPWNP